MGFMGMAAVVDSDAASDHVATIAHAMAALMRIELVSKHTSLNTPGEVNVALAFEGVVLPALDVFQSDDDLMKVAVRTIKMLRDRRGREKRAKFTDYLNDYERMIASLQRFVDAN